MNDPEVTPPKIAKTLSRDLSLLHITMMGVGMMIGAGVFLGIGSTIAIAGPGGVILTFALNGIVALFTAMSYAELSSSVPRAGGAYNFTRIAFGRGISFVAGWMEWFASSAAGGLYAVTFAIYTVHYFSQLGLIQFIGVQLPVMEKLVAVVIAGIFLYINYRGVSQTGKVGALLTLGQTLTLVFIALAGIVTALYHPERLANFKPFLPNGWMKLLITMGFTYVAFEGFEVIAQAGDEVREPRRNLPKAMIYSVLIVVLVYVGVSFASVVAVKGVGEPAWVWIGKFGEKGFGEAVSRLIPFGGFLTTIAVIFASTSALNATIYSGTRVSYALGRDRMLPHIFSYLSKRRITPHIALIFTGVIVICVAAFLPVIDLASSASIMFLFLFFLVNLCVIRTRHRMGRELNYGFLMPFFPFPPIVAIIVQAVLAMWLVHMSLVAWIVGPAWVFSGILVYYLYSKHKTTSIEEEIIVLEQEPILNKRGYRIMLAVANPANAVQLAQPCYQFCQAKKAEVEAIHIVSVPPQVPLSDAFESMFAAEEAITEAMLYLSTDFTFGSTIRYCRSAARGIISATREQKTDLLIMGWEGHENRSFSLGSTVDPVLEGVSCNVAVLRNCHHQSYLRVLVPFTGAPNSAFTLEVASILVEPQRGRVVLFHVHPSGRPRPDIEAFLEKTTPSLGVDGSIFEPKYIAATNLLKTLLREAEHYDLIVIGASQEKLFQRIVMGRLPEEFAHRCQKPLVMVKASSPVKSMLSRWI